MTLYAWGTNSRGELGLGFASDQELEPVKVPLDSSELKAENIVEICGGSNHTLILDNNGRVYSSGWNSKGQLGGFDDALKFTLVEILKGFRIVHIACGFDFSAAITECEKLFVWGNNAYTQLGLSKSITSTSIPSRLQVSSKLAKGYKKVSCGLRHMAVINSENCLLVAGTGKHGRLGLGNNFDDNNYVSINKVPDLENVQSVACGELHTVALKSDGTVLSWGDNKYGQLGVDSETKNSMVPTTVFTDESIKEVFAGWSHSAALTDTGEVYVWGRNTYGQLGSSRVSDCHIPQKLTQLKDIDQVSLGSEHNLAITKDGKLYCWGWNEHGNCGTANIKDVVSPKKLLSKHKVRLAAACTGHSFAVV